MRYSSAVDATPDPTTTVDAACRADALCSYIATHTGVTWLADTGYYVVLKPVRILLIIVAAVVLRSVTHRMIRRLTSQAAEQRLGLLNPLRERMLGPLQEAATVGERRKQRAAALGSVLRSVASITIFSIAALMVLSELGLDLAPLLASAGIAGVAIGFGAQNLVKDFLAGLFMLLEDQYGVGDVVDLGEVGGTVEEVGLRITTIRDAKGVLWYIRNGEIVRVGNRSQGWAVVVVDVPVGFAGVEEATEVLRAAAASLHDDPQYAADLLEAPQVLGVEQISIDGAVVRTTVRTASAAQWRVARELRRRLTDALESAGIAQHLTATMRFVRPQAPPPPPVTEPFDEDEPRTSG
jgi:small conductance mechanosensitive channel